MENASTAAFRLGISRLSTSNTLPVMTTVPDSGVSVTISTGFSRGVLPISTEPGAGFSFFLSAFLGAGATSWGQSGKIRTPDKPNSAQMRFSSRSCSSRAGWRVKNALISMVRFSREITTERTRARSSPPHRSFNPVQQPNISRKPVSCAIYEFSLSISFINACARRSASTRPTGCPFLNSMPSFFPPAMP